MPDIDIVSRMRMCAAGCGETEDTGEYNIFQMEGRYRIFLCPDCAAEECHAHGIIYVTAECPACEEDEDEDSGGYDYVGDPQPARSTLCGCPDCRGTLRRREGDYTIHPYSFRPTPNFHGTDSHGLFMGLELEVDTDDGDMDEMARKANDALGRVGYLKEDGSVNGFEIVTHPMSFSWAMGHFPWQLLPDLRNMGARALTGCGLHIHVSRNGFGRNIGRVENQRRVGVESHQYRWAKFVYRSESAFTRLARRNPQEWGAFRPSMREYARHHIKGDRRSMERYSAINMLPEQTFEIRFFRSTLRPERLKAAMQLISGSIEYTRDLDAAQIVRDRRTWTFDGFLSWLNQSPETYGEAITEISREV